MKQRKGALLLIVLLLLTAILLLGLSFLVTAMSYQRAASSTVNATRNISAREKQRLMNSTLLQLVRGTNNSNSAIYGHSLLEDLYGDDGFRCTATEVEFLNNGEFARIEFATTDSGNVSLENHAYDGCVVTVRTDSDEYRSGRIVEFIGDANEFIASGLGPVKEGDGLIINGYPFNADLASSSAASDEPWDAIDEHNLALARIPTNGLEPSLPSFHRPNAISSRLKQEDHPQFAASNLAFDEVDGPWDVDNDGDGIPDSVWIDAGLAPIDIGDGTRCKPLVAVLVMDMDGRVNLNAHGNLAQVIEPPVGALDDRTPSPGTRLANNYPRGHGAGPAEVDIRPFFNDAEALTRFFQSRYGDRMLGPYSETRLPSQPFGTSFTYVDELGHPVHVAPPSTYANPYATSQLDRRTGDTKFQDRDLEWLARNYDYDLVQRKNRLAKLIDPQNARLLTTASYSIPSLPKTGDQGIVEKFRNRLRKHGVAEDQLETQLQLMLPPEILRGEKMDLNRSFVRDDGRTWVSGGIPRKLIPEGTPFTPLDEVQYAKGLFARHLYCLAMTFVSDEDLDGDEHRLRARELAQWAANAVDFRDNDGVHTPFEYDANPWDGWGTNGILKSDYSNVDGTTKESPSDPNLDVVWGLERPELLMTESLALHDRMVGDFEVGGLRKAKPGEQSDNDLDQIRKPRGPLLIELHSPHQYDEGIPQPIDPNGDTNATHGLYYSRSKSNPVLNMDKIERGARGLRSSVWRVAISEFHGRKSESEKKSPLQLSDSESNAARCEPDRPCSMIDKQSPVLYTERVIWLASEQPSIMHPDFGRTYYTETIPGFWPLKAQIPLGKTAVIAPFANFTIGSGERTDAPWTFYATRQRFVFAGGADPAIEYETETGEVSRVAALSIMSTSGPMPTGGGRATSFSVSATEPLPRNHSRVYGVRPDVVRDQPCDTLPGAPMAVDPKLRETHTENNFKTAFLQRLADPAFGWNPEFGRPMHDPRFPVNPYVTVDWIPIQLSVFNSGLLPNEIESWIASSGDFDPDDPKFDDPDFSYSRALKFGTLEWNGKSEPTDPFMASRSSTVGKEIGNFWGIEPRVNRHRTTSNKQRPPLRLGHSIGYVADDAKRSDEESSEAQIPRPWLAWKNADFVNRFELLNVPKSSPARLRLEFSTAAKMSSPRFRHLLNFDNDRLRQLFDFVCVADGFADSYRSNTSTGLRRSRFREPGKVNVNTIADPRIWRAIGGDRLATWQDFVKSREAEPFRSQLNSDDRLSLWSRKREFDQQPLLLPKTERMHANAYRNASIYHQGWQKLAKSTTTQSNVYAIWITLGFFELHPNYPALGSGADDYSRPWYVDAKHPDGNRVGSEVTASGLSRHRSFYLVDRSIPMAFERGTNHNVDRSIRLKRQLE